MSATLTDEEPAEEPSYRPSRVAAGLAVGAGLVLLVVTAVSSVLSFAVVGLGLWFLIVGLALGRKLVVTAGTLCAFVGVLLAGVVGAPPLVLLVAGIGVVVLYDASHFAVRLGTQLRGNADTGRTAAVHVGATTLIASSGGIIGYLIFELGSGQQPVPALLALLLAAVLLLWGLQSR